MYRKFYQTLNNWLNGTTHKPLLVVGARQIGKTWLIEEFCGNAENGFFEINLERQREYISVFEGSLEPENIITNMEMLSGKRIDRDGIIFIDEIQVSERAITSLKYFCESENDYKIIGAGSLLGVKLDRFETSFPVGKVSVRQMFPMDFEEFLTACDELPLIDGIRRAFKSKTALPDGIHEKAIRLYREYLFVGGMPEIVSSYIDAGKNTSGLDENLFRSIEISYSADMTKYTLSAAEGVKISEVYESVPRQLARENPKFKYKDIRAHANRRDFASSIDWLVASGMVYRVKKIDAPHSPIKGYEDPDSFRVYLSDVGMLVHMTGMRMRDMMPDVHNIYKGGVTENYVVEQFAAAGKNLNYFKPSDSMEIDLIMDTEEGIIPVEIKSGRHKRSTSLKNYREKYAPPYAIRISENNFGETDGQVSVPLYAVFCL